MNRLNCFLKCRRFYSKDAQKLTTEELQITKQIPRYRFYLNDQALKYDQNKLDEFEQNINDRKKIWRLTGERYGLLVQYWALEPLSPLI